MDRAFFQRLSVQIGHDTNEAGAEASTDILTSVWHGRVMRLMIFLARLLRMIGISLIANRLRSRYQRYLSIVASRRENVELAMGEMEYRFIMWEHENRQFGCGRKETLADEERAATEAKNQIQLMQEELTAAGWPHKLKQVRELAPSFEGRIYNHSAQYWVNLDKHLKQVIERLS